MQIKKWSLTFFEEYICFENVIFGLESVYIWLVKPILVILCCIAAVLYF